MTWCAEDKETPFFVEKLHSGRCQSERESQVEVMSICGLHHLPWLCKSLWQAQCCDWGKAS